MTNPDGVLSAMRRARAAACTGLALACAAGVARADSGTTACPGSPGVWEPPPAPAPAPGPSVDADGLWRIDAPASAVPPLKPGTTRKTPGEAITPPLDGPVILQSNVPFKMIASDGQEISGQLWLQVVNENKGRCGYYFRVAVDKPTPHVVTHLVIGKFTHPKNKLFGDYRNDIEPGGIPSQLVSRSADAGDEIDFNLGAGVPQGLGSRVLMLNSNIGFTHLAGVVQVEAEDGTLSQPFPAWVPAWP